MMTHKGSTFARDGLTRKISAEALRTSILFAPVFRLMRFFGDDRLDSKEMEQSTTSDNEQTNSKLHPAKITGYTFDCVEDDAHHPWYDLIFTEVLPGERLALSMGTKCGAWRRQKMDHIDFHAFSF